MVSPEVTPMVGPRARHAHTEDGVVGHSHPEGPISTSDRLPCLRGFWAGVSATTPHLCVFVQSWGLRPDHNLQWEIVKLSLTVAQLPVSATALCQRDCALKGARPRLTDKHSPM